MNLKRVPRLTISLNSSATRMIHPLPTSASCATCTPSISKLLLPTIVRPLAAVPRLIVTFSRIRLLSPISAVDSSPRNLRSCGMAPITAPGKIVFPLPIREPYKILALASAGRHVIVPCGIAGSDPSWYLHDERLCIRRREGGL